MSTTVNLNGVSYDVPTTGEVGWGNDMHNYLVALGSGGVLQLAGGNFTLQSEVNFGSTFGLKAPYYKGVSALPAQSGTIRLGATESINWRNNTNTADLQLYVSGNQLFFNGIPLGGGGGGGSPLTTKGDLYTFSAVNARLPVGLNGQALIADSTQPTGLRWASIGGGGGAGTVTDFSFTNANGISGTVTNSTITPNLTLSLGAITPTSVAASGTVTGSNLSGSNTGDQTIILTGDVTGSGTGTFATTLTATGVTPGLYTNANITVDAKGRITSASSGGGGGGGGGGSVTSVSVVPANGVSGTVTNPTTTPAITLSLGNITPSSIATSGNITMNGTGATFRGDFTNATRSNRNYFQTTTLNGDTTISSAPNGTSTLGSFSAENSSNINNVYRISMFASNTQVGLDAAVRGTGTPLPMNITNNGNQAISISTTGNVTFPKNVTVQGTFIAPNVPNVESKNLRIGIGAGAALLNTPVPDSPIYNTFYGTSAGGNTTTGNSNVSIGYATLIGNTTGSNNVAVGKEALGYNASAATGYQNTAIGNQSLLGLISGYQNTSVGANTSPYLTTGYQNTSVGYSSGLNAGQGAFVNTTSLGYAAAVTGSNQVQLGNSSTTTYAYGAVQNRSDIRDKTDITDTALGLNFIMELRPVDFRWDMRDYYKTENQESLNDVVKDGSKKRSRKHHGLIAQEVKAVMNKIGVDFGGYQDHSISGGDDVLSIGYDELIAPLIKAIQELKAELDAVKRSINN